MKKIIIRFISVSILQWILLYMLLSLYNYFFPGLKPDLSFGISCYYYITFIFPVILIIWNIVTLSCAKKVKITINSMLVFVILFYWFSGLNNYPYRISFLLFCSILILIIGAYILYKR